ncbi:Spo0E family sporulation regulatory protein-aspartic acid phosphatase [Paenibacillus polymyxa]|uniref:Spo0E family sporulation regulatory protein-aspartic acid phosphatase n=1 Tax=Paenibacillus polymyxa TaxID=1406 RepID=UPI0008FC93F4|nr:Spo0E family sporulation regulatory protein-aspartic acid phosphatase [Paenibacillus polymyxa]
MNELLERMEEERRKLNVLGQNAIEQSILLSESPEVQEQSRKLDELLALYQNMKAKRTEQML